MPIALRQPRLAQALEEQLAAVEIDRIIAQRDSLVPGNRVLGMKREPRRRRGARLLHSPHMRQGGGEMELGHGIVRVRLDGAPQPGDRFLMPPRRIFAAPT